MNLQDAERELMACTMAGNAVLMSSGSGIGKSQLQLQVFGKIKERDAAKGIRWGLGTIFLATQTPPDLIGYQFKGEREFKMTRQEGHKMAEPFAIKVAVTEPTIPLWMISVPHAEDPGGKPAFLYDRFYLMIEEYGQGDADVKRAAAEIFLNGGTAPWYLPPGSIRVASTNEGSRYGVTKDFDFCIARRTLIRVDGDVDIWTRWADKPYLHQGRNWQTMPFIKAWAKRHPEIIFEKEPAVQGPFCNPRTLCSVDRYLQVKMELSSTTDIPSDPVTQDVMAGTIGMPATQSICTELQFLQQLPKYEEVVKDPQGTEVPKKADLLLLMAYQLAGLCKAPDLAPVIQYVQRLPKDMAVTFVSALLRRDYKGIINEPAMQGWISKNATLVTIISSLAQ